MQNEGLEKYLNQFSPQLRFLRYLCCYLVPWTILYIIIREGHFSLGISIFSIVVIVIILYTIFIHKFISATYSIIDSYKKLRKHLLHLGYYLKTDILNATPNPQQKELITKDILLATQECKKLGDLFKVISFSSYFYKSFYIGKKIRGILDILFLDYIYQIDSTYLYFQKLIKIFLYNNIIDIKEIEDEIHTLSINQEVDPKERALSLISSRLSSHIENVEKVRIRL